MKRTACFLTTCAIAALSSSAAFGTVTLLDDHFNDGTLGTNPDTGGGFGALGNGAGTAGTVTESGSQAKIVEGTSTNTYGILSSNAFDLSNASLSYTVTWTVANWTMPAGTGTRRALFSLQSNDSFVFSSTETESSRIALTLDDNTNVANLTYQNRSAGNSNNVNFVSSNFTLDGTFAGDPDGFTVTLVLDSNGYSFTTTGLATANQVNLAGAWGDLNNGGTNFTTALGTDGPMYVGAYVQHVNATGAALDIDRITLTSIPEPTGVALLGLSGLCLMTRRRR